LPEAVAAALAVASALYVAGGALGKGFPVDDAWIHMVYGLGLVKDGALAYNDGVPATGSTSPLWALFAALAHALVGARVPAMGAALALKLCGLSCHVAASVLAARLARAGAPRHLAPHAALAAGLLVAACPLLAYAAVSGMEVALTSALCLGALLAAHRGRAALAGLAAGLAILARPESAALVPIVLGALVLGVRRRRAVRRVLVAGGMASAIALGLAARHLAVSGRPLPATFYAKAAFPHFGFVAQIRLGVGFFEVLGGIPPTSFFVLWIFLAIAALSPFGAAAIARRVPVSRPTRRACAAAATAALSGVAYAAATSLGVRIMAPGTFYFQRYLAPSLPLLCVGATLGLSLVARRRGVVLVIAALTLAATFAGLGRERARYAADVEDIDAVQVAIGRFLARALPSDAIVWSMDAGAPRYFGQRRVVDLGLLNTPDLFAGYDVRAGNDAHAIVTLEGPIHVLAADGALEPILGVRAPHSLAPGFTQVVRRCLVATAVEIEGYPEPRRGRCAAP
jgi:hypothetical protein